MQAVLSTVLSGNTRPATRRMWLVCGLLVASLGSYAHAQSDDARTAQAEQLFHEGLAQFHQGQFDEARVKFEHSLSLVPGIGVRGKLAECYEKLGRTASAQRLYREVALIARQLGDIQRANIAAARANGLDAHVARLVIEPGPSVAIPGFVVRRNGKSLEPRLLRTVLVVDPGTQVVVAEAPHHQRWMGSVQIAPGQTTRVSIPSLTPGDGSESSVSSVSGLDTDAASETEQDEAPEARGGSSLGALLFGAGAVSLVGGGGYFALRARSRWNEASSRCTDMNVCDPIGAQLASEARTSANVAGVFAGLGLAAMTTGAILWWRSRDEPDYSDSELHITPVATPEGVGFTLFNRF